MKEFYETKVKDIMQNKLWDLPIVNKDANINLILLIIISRGYVWVVDNKKLVGIITEHDILDLLENYNNKIKAEDIMKRELITCKKEDKIIDVIYKIKKYKVRRLPVIENDKFVGEITLRHLIEKLLSLFS